MRIEPINIASLSLVMYSLTGNAMAAGIDIGITIIASIWILTLAVRKQSLKSPRLSSIGFGLTILAAFQARAIFQDTPYFETYWIWPTKSAILLLLAATTRNLDWPRGNTKIYFTICLLLLFLGHFENGRLYSVFGPNMLYRIFGFLYLISTIELLHLPRGNPRSLPILFSLTSLVLMLLTGSVGALIIALFPVIHILRRMSKAKFATLAASTLFIFYTLLNIDFDSDLLTTFSRTAFKIATVYESERIAGWKSIFELGFSVVGNDYQRYSSLWFFGYEYAHNIAVELISMFGLTGLLTFIILVLTAIAHINNKNPLYLLFICIFSGSLLSGDMSDNFAAVSLGLIILLKPRIQSIRSEKVDRHTSIPAPHPLRAQVAPDPSK
jgi:hypothetical protein